MCVQNAINEYLENAKPIIPNGIIYYTKRRNRLFFKTPDTNEKIILVVSSKVFKKIKLKRNQLYPIKN